MEEIYRYPIEEFIQSIYIVTSRRTSSKFAEESMYDAFDILQNRYSLFKKIEINKKVAFGTGFKVNLSDNIKNIQTNEIAHALESLLRVIYDDISEESGLYFITEIKNHVGKETVYRIIDLGVDLEQIQNEQHLTYNRKKRKKELKDNGKQENPLGYTWGSVGKWNYNDSTKEVELYDIHGNLLDKIDIENAIRSYVENLSGITESSPLELAKLLDKHEKAYSFLKLVHSENIDFKTAKNMLNLNDEEINQIIKELLELKLLQYISDDEIEITESGKAFISKQ